MHTCVVINVVCILISSHHCLVPSRAALHYRKVLKQIVVAELQPDETVDAVREARLLAKVNSTYIH